LPIVGPNILQHVHNNDDSAKEKEHVIVSSKSSLDMLNLPTIDANNAILEPSLDLPRSQVVFPIDCCDKEELW
jgi:hypothetical protein